jgi:hypothetical protein
MILYHGSAGKYPVLKKQQASSNGDVSVPEDELREGIYLTPDFGFAVAIGAMPEGGVKIDEKTIEFDHPDLFDPEKEIFVYEVDTDKIPKEHLRQFDKQQYIVEGLDEISFEAVHQFKAEEVLKYYELTNWKREGKEMGSEIRLK